MRLKCFLNTFNVTTDQLLGKEELYSDKKLTSNVLEVKETGKPSLLHRWSILLPLMIWIVAFFNGPVYFVIFGLVFLVFWIIYGLTQLNGRYEATYQNHQIVVTVSAKAIRMYIDDKLVDTTGVPMGANYRLDGVIDNVSIKAKVHIFLFSSCTIFVE
jgi:hypothetical protein